MSDNELAVGTFCERCGCRLNDAANLPRPRPFGPHAEEGER